jgi:nanoRNase/pAp phosphatase (c-di-AMP/oligoRNAs hydrolase)
MEKLNIMLDESILNQIRSLVAESKRILVLTHKNPSPDGIASLLAFGEMLSRLKKEYVLACPDPLPEELRVLKNTQQIIQKIGPRNLIITVKNGKDAIEKVSYFTSDDKFNLVITPHSQSLSLDQIEYSFTGPEVDLIIILDTIKPEGLGGFMEELNHELKQFPIINIDRHSQNTQFGKLNLVDNRYSSTSEIMLELIGKMGVDCNSELSTLLLFGIYGGTKDFKSRTTTVQTFRNVITLLDKKADLDFILRTLYTISASEETLEKTPVIVPQASKLKKEEVNLEKEPIIEESEEESALPTPVLKPQP